MISFESFNQQKQVLRAPASLARVTQSDFWLKLTISEYN